MIGRVGRAERMGLAISLVSCIPEKVNKNNKQIKIFWKKGWNYRLNSFFNDVCLRLLEGVKGCMISWMNK